jgi:hypothetical protein
VTSTIDPREGPGLGPHDHVCLAYDQADRARDEMAAFLELGLDRDEQAWYVAPGTVDELLGHLRARLPDADARVRSGALRLVSMDDVYAPGSAVGPVSQVDVYARGTEAAEADGYARLRVAAAVTDLVRTPHQLDSFARYESLVDRYTAVRPFSAMCAFDRAELGDRSIAAVACMHPKSTPGATAFNLYASATVDAALSGEVDIAVIDDFRTALGRAALEPTGDELRIDATRLNFLDHRGVAALGELAHERGCTVVLRTASTMPSRVIDLVQPAAVRAEPGPGPVAGR